MALVECKYKEVDIQVKEQFIHGLNNDKMPVVVTRELTMCREDVTIPCVTVLAWAKRVEAQNIQTAVISSLCESRNFDASTH